MEGEEVQRAYTVKSFEKFVWEKREMGRDQLKEMWSQERIVFRMEDMNDPLEGERLKLQESAQTEESIFGRRWDPET